jgi:hypothetical protein
LALVERQTPGLAQDPARKAVEHSAEVDARGLIAAVEESDAIRDLGSDMFGIDRRWHKRIVRAGPNALQPYRHNPPDRTTGPTTSCSAISAPSSRNGKLGIPKLTGRRSACEARHDPRGEFFYPRPALTRPATCDVAHAQLLQSLQIWLDRVERVRRK